MPSVGESSSSTAVLGVSAFVSVPFEILCRFLGVSFEAGGFVFFCCCCLVDLRFVEFGGSGRPPIRAKYSSTTSHALLKRMSARSPRAGVQRTEDYPPVPSSYHQDRHNLST